MKYHLVNRIKQVVKKSDDKQELLNLQDGFNMDPSEWLEEHPQAQNDVKIYYKQRKLCIELLDDVGHAMYLPPFKVIENGKGQ